MDTLIEGIQFILDWLNNGIFLFFDEFFKQLVAWLVVAKLQFMLWTLQFSWGVASTIIVNLNLGAYIQQAFASLDSQLLGYLNFFKIPESINLILQAYITRLTLTVMGW